MIIQENTVVSLNYTLKNHNTGELIEQTSIENPMVFLYGVGGLIPEFETNLQGKKTGDSFEFAIQSDRAYGEQDPNQIAMIPADVFLDESGKFDSEFFKVGAIVPMSDSEGNHLRGIVLDVEPEFVRMDFNHPLAGIDLHFSGEVLELREATEEELSHGHVHGPGGHQH